MCFVYVCMGLCLCLCICECVFRKSLVESFPVTQCYSVCLHLGLLTLLINVSVVKAGAGVVKLFLHIISGIATHFELCI